MFVTGRSFVDGGILLLMLMLLLLLVVVVVVVVVMIKVFGIVAIVVANVFMLSSVFSCCFINCYSKYLGID